MILAYNNSRNKNIFIVDSEVFPQTLAVLETRAEPLGIDIIQHDLDSKIPLSDFENAFGYEYIYFVGGNPQAKYAALVFDGPRTNANGMTFTNSNTSNIFLTNLANPTISDSTFTLGVDAYSLGKRSAIDALGAGAGISDPVLISGSSFTGDSEGSCGNSGSGIQMIYADNSYISIDNFSCSFSKTFIPDLISQYKVCSGFIFVLSPVQADIISI